MGIKGPRVPWGAYVLPITIGAMADLLIVLAGAARGTQEYTGIMLLLQAPLLGFLFGARLGMVAALTPLIAIGIWLMRADRWWAARPGCGPDCGETDRRVRVRVGAGCQRVGLSGRCVTDISPWTLRPAEHDRLMRSTTGWGEHGLMFEIGPSLREARERRGLAYSQVEADTAIRSRYIRALEEEEFDILPGPTYTKGFLRSYAEYLGLDGELFVDEFNSRHHDPRREFDQPIASRPRSRPQQQRRRRESQLVMIVLAAIVAVTSVIFLVALKRPATPGAAADDEPAVEHHAAEVQLDHQHDHRQAHDQRARRHPQEVHGGADRLEPVLGFDPQRIAGRQSGDLHATAPTCRATRSIPAIDNTVTFTSKQPVYMQVGAPGSLTVTINGKATPLPQTGATIRVTNTGLAPA